MVSLNLWSAPSTPSSSTGSGSGLPADHPPVSSSADQCPVDHTARSRWLQAAGDDSATQAQAEAAHPFRTTRIPNYQAGAASSLSTEREVSSIPRGKLASSAHVGSSEGSGSDSDEKWVYPSQQQFYSAMQRKNHNPQAKDMRSVVPIHNAVNERAWEEILEWERGMGSERCGGPRLISFAGLPRQRTPKARIFELLGHDWIIDRCGTQIRYVIDFYSGRRDPKNPQNMAFFLDVRPALDDRVHVETRLKGWWNQLTRK